VTALALGAVISGCSSSSGNSSDSGKIHLQLWNPETDAAEVAVFKSIVADYEKDHPNVSVNLVTIPWSDIYQKWQTALQAGKAPDATIGSVSFASSFQEQGVLEPLDDVVKKMGGDSVWADSASSLVELSKSKGSYFTLPLVHNSVVLWYDKPMFEAAGIQPPKTWDELDSAAKALTHGDQYGILIPSSTSQVTNQSLYSLILANGGDVVDRKNPNTVTFDSKKSVEALDFYAKLSKYSPPGSGGYDRPEAQAAMTTGKLGMFIYGSWMQSALEAAGPDVAAKFGAVPVPTNNGGGGAFMGNLSMFQFKSSKHPQETKDLLSYFYDPKRYEKLVLVNPASFYPVLKATAESPTYTGNEKVVANKELNEAVTTTLPKAWIFGLPNPHAGEWEGLNLIAEAATSVIQQGQSPQDAAKAVADKMKASIK
jgi:multiple sugar transport system substrate-binding protein